MSAIFIPILKDVFVDAALVAAFMAIVAKVINIMIKAFSRGEIVV